MRGCKLYIFVVTHRVAGEMRGGRNGCICIQPYYVVAPTGRIDRHDIMTKKRLRSISASTLDVYLHNTCIGAFFFLSYRSWIRAELTNKTWPDNWMTVEYIIKAVRWLTAPLYGGGFTTHELDLWEFFRIQYASFYFYITQNIELFLWAIFLSFKLYYATYFI